MEIRRLSSKNVVASALCGVRLPRPWFGEASRIKFGTSCDEDNAQFMILIYHIRQGRSIKKIIFDHDNLRHACRQEVPFKHCS